MPLGYSLGRLGANRVTVNGDAVDIQAVGLADVAGLDALGEVAASPTANTLLARLKTIGDAAVAATPAGETHIGEVGGRIVNISANFTRPADTTAYASGDLVANSVTAGSVVPMTFTNAARIAAGNFCVLRARVSKTTTGVTNAAFRVHLFTTSPTNPTNGDNGAFVPSQIASYLGYFDITAMVAGTAGAAGQGGLAAGFGNSLAVALGSGRDIYGLLEARGAYTPGSAEVFTTTLEIGQN